MSYFAAGAWWTSDGRPFASEAEANQAESSGAGQSTDDEFAAAMGRGSGVKAPASAATAPTRASSGPLSSSRASGFQGAPNAAPAVSPAQQQGAFTSGNIGGAGGAGGSQQVLTDRAKTPSDPGLFRQAANLGSSFLGNPIVNPIGYGLGKAGQAVDRAFGTSVSGYIQDPVGQGLSDLGAPDAVQAIANPTGYITRNAVNSGTNYGMNPGAIAQNAANSFDNLRNDAQNTAAAVKQVPAAVSGFAGSIVNAATQQRGTGSGTNAAAYQPQPLPTPSMTPQSILGMNTDAARPSSTQSDGIVNQMLAQSQQQSGYQDFSNANYDASRGAAMGYTGQLAGLANNNVGISGLDAGRYDQSRGQVNQITGQLQSQAQNNVGDIQAASGQRDQSRDAVMSTGNRLTRNADRDIGPIIAENGARTSIAGTVRDRENALSNLENVGDIQAQTGRYDASSATSNDIIQRLLAASALPDDQSQAEALMLNAQERAVRNAYGDAGSLGGGWRSQLTGQRRALGQAATMQADIAAQLGALRASETQQNRQRQLEALGAAGGLAGDMSGRDLSLAQSDAALLAQIQQGNQENTRLGLTSAGQLGLGRLGDETSFQQGEANRAAAIAQANQANRLNSLLGAGGLQTSAMQSDTGLAQSNASLLAQVRQGNQLNSLNSLQAAGQTAGTALNADLGFATSDAQIRTQRELANQANSLAAMQAAANAANQTAGLDANIGMNNSNNRVTVDQNNRANSIASLQNAGVLSSTIRGQDVQLSVANQQALSSRISSAAQLSGTQFATQMDAALRQTDQQLRQQQFEFMKTQSPQEWERWLAAAGSTAGLLGVFL